MSARKRGRASKALQTTGLDARTKKLGEAARNPAKDGYSGCRLGLHLAHDASGPATARGFWANP
jgi:hypothetical protein